MPALSPLLASIAQRIGAAHVLTDPADMAPYLREERGLYQGEAPAVLRPGTTEEVAFIVEACARAGVALVPQGGNTGLVGGQMPFGQMVLSLARLDRVRAVDPVDMTMTVEAGCILDKVHAAAEEAGCLFPLHIASQGSCRIGGNLSSNAGGTAVLRYGNARELVLGLEVVLADGRVWNGLKRLRKNNAGYDLKQLFLGTEGTLGVITAAVLKLFPQPAQRATAFLAVPDPAAALALLKRLRGEAGDALTTFELMSGFGVETVLKHMPGAVRPLANTYEWYVLAELSSPTRAFDLGALLEEGLAAAMEAGEVLDAVIAASEAQAANLWRLREDMSEAQKHEGGSIKHDVSVPVSRVPEFLERALPACLAALPGLRPCPFGHVGDGNIHFNLSQPEGMEKAAFIALWETFNRIVHDIVTEMDGSIAAEHGIGRLKREELAHYADPVALELMHRVKAALDPAQTLNPGKVIGVQVG
ncbi:FAD-binding oxidoreductase [Ancylobacter dichloromethanicus]|uniref:D-2-hydroxyacid dehydrogenase n=1 Tax=Ancylobacter dichloromethanicus TaxID=518825 RepID=A0A9W6J5U9_9HYPH|nr:FAD-binding oxidoreductase [Ancylobacter dichloromethanicus]MBS7556205.1 FAD-binding oxidoreductase [Ancylobacter dichloromethanicus]GLK69959.1 D-2-hydroxyacid dehydrogenase [Ancylobacter dichloromethanicus]